MRSLFLTMVGICLLMLILLGAIISTEYDTPVMNPIDKAGPYLMRLPHRIVVGMWGRFSIQPYPCNQDNTRQLDVTIKYFTSACPGENPIGEADSASAATRPWLCFGFHALLRFFPRRRSRTHLACFYCFQQAAAQFTYQRPLLLRARHEILFFFGARRLQGEKKYRGRNE